MLQELILKAERLLRALFGAETALYAAVLIDGPALGGSVNSESSYRAVLCADAAVYAGIQIALDLA